MDYTFSIEGNCTYSGVIEASSPQNAVNLLSKRHKLVGKVVKLENEYGKRWVFKIESKGEFIVAK